MMPLLAALALAATVYLYGWAALIPAVVLAVAAYLWGHGVALYALRREGYTVEYSADMTGRKRWRVGVTEREAAVEWLKPGEQRHA